MGGDPDKIVLSGGFLAEAWRPIKCRDWHTPRPYPPAESGD